MPCSPASAAVAASKQAIEGFTGSLALELAPFNVQAKLVEPGYGPTTRFAANTGVNVRDLIPEAYADFARAVFGDLANPAMTGAPTTKETDVAEGVWRAVNDTTGTLRFPAGADAVALARAA